MRSDPGQSPPSRLQVLLVALSFEGGLVVLWLILGGFLERPPSSQGSLSIGALGAGIAATLPLLPLLYWMSRTPFGPVRRVMRLIDESIIPLLSPLGAQDLALIAALAGIGEEGLFRGILQNELAAAFSPFPAIAAAGVLFGLLHGVTPAYGVIAGVLGIYLGGLHYATGNVVVPVVVHGLYDFLALMYLVKWRRM